MNELQMYLHLSHMIKELLRKIESIEERLDKLSENVGSTVTINWNTGEEDEDEDSDTEDTESAQSAPF